MIHILSKDNYAQILPKIPLKVALDIKTHIVGCVEEIALQLNDQYNINTQLIH